jgi:uncharacterized membrane protein
MPGFNGLNWQGQHNYTVSFVLGHPIRTAVIFLRSLWENGQFYLFSCIGRHFSGLTLKVHKIYSILMIILLFLSVSDGGSKSKNHVPSSAQRACYLGVSAIITGLVMMALFLAWTSDTSPVVMGVQGRYFIPIIPLVLFAMKTRRAITRKWYCPALVLSALLINSAILLEIYSKTL